VLSRAIFGSEEVEVKEDEELVGRSFKERVAAATSTGSADEALAARIAAGEFSSSNPLVEFFKPLRKTLSQLGGPGAWRDGGNPHPLWPLRQPPPRLACAAFDERGHAARPCLHPSARARLGTAP
jgi:hypothetical protein